MKAQHTPGPWETYCNAHNDFTIRKMFKDGLESHEVARCKSGWENARLIASAPELLEALQYAIKQVPELGSVPGVAAAIAKATGGAE